MGAQHYDLDSRSCLHQSPACEWTASESESSGSLKIQHACTELPASPTPAQDKSVWGSGVLIENCVQNAR